jgi:dolichol-phosphate mannosyltransferase
MPEAAATPVELDIIVPVFNEGANILAALGTLDRHVKTPHRILVCYDFDDDNTLEALQQYAHPEKIVLVKNEGRGPHRAVTTGFKASRAPAALVFPADDLLNASIVDAMYEKIRGGCDIAAASRFIPGGEMIDCPWLKDRLVRLASFTLNALAGLPIHDASNGFRMFSRRVLDTIPIESTQGFTYSIELTTKCQRLGWSMAELPARWRERERGASRFMLFRWLAPYLRWYLYAFATTWLFRRRVRGVDPTAIARGASP